MQRQFFSGNSLEQAVISAARHFGIDPEQVAYSARDKKHGFLSARRRVVIEVDPESPAKTEEAIVDEPIEVAAIAETTSAEAVAGSYGAEDSDEEELERRDAKNDSDSASDDGNHHEDGHDGDAEDKVEVAAEEDDSKDRDSDDGEEAENRSRSAKEGGRGGRGRGGRGKAGGGRRSGGRGGRGSAQRGTAVRELGWVDIEREEFEVDEEVGKEISAIEFGIERILDVMDLEIEYSVVEGDPFEIEFSGEDSDLLVEDDGRVLKAIEHVLPRVTRGLVGESLGCKVDCDGFRASHEESLRELALSAADDVRDSGKARTLAPMNPADRRIIHVALRDDEDVETQSKGSGFIKRVKIYRND